MLAKLAVAGGDAVAAMRADNAFQLTREVADEQRVFLVRADDDRLLLRVDLVEEQLDALPLALLDHDHVVEIALLERLPRLPLLFDDFIVGGMRV